MAVAEQDVLLRTQTDALPGNEDDEASGFTAAVASRYSA